MTRYTPKQLERDVDDMNDQLAAAGLTARLFCGGRNGYQAVDLYDHLDSGPQRGEFHCLRNVGCGTSREVIGYAREEFYRLLNAAK